jgi:hypothetical protein
MRRSLRHCERSEAIQLWCREKESWIASSLTLLAMTWRGPESNFQTGHHSKTNSRDLAALRARVLPEISRPLLSEGAGNAGRPMRPIAACAMVVVERTRVSQVTPESPGTPRAMVYGLFRALPGDRALLPPSPALLSANLTPASGHQDHTSSPSAEPARSSLAQPASTASRIQRP